MNGVGVTLSAKNASIHALGRPLTVLRNWLATCPNTVAGRTGAQEVGADRLGLPSHLDQP